MNTRTEPIRLPLWLASLLTVVILPGIVSYLTGASLRDCILAAIAAVIPLIGAGEVARAQVNSPQTGVALQAQAHTAGHESGYQQAQEDLRYLSMLGPVALEQIAPMLPPEATWVPKLPAETPPTPPGESAS